MAARSMVYSEAINLVADVDSICRKDELPICLKYAKVEYPDFQREAVP